MNFLSLLIYFVIPVVVGNHFLLTKYQRHIPALINVNQLYQCNLFFAAKISTSHTSAYINVNQLYQRNLFLLPKYQRHIPALISTWINYTNVIIFCWQNINVAYQRLSMWISWLYQRESIIPTQSLFADKISTSHTSAYQCESVDYFNWSTDYTNAISLTFQRDKVPLRIAYQRDAWYHIGIISDSKIIYLSGRIPMSSDYTNVISLTFQRNKVPSCIAYHHDAWYHIGIISDSKIIYLSGHIPTSTD